MFGRLTNAASSAAASAQQAAQQAAQTVAEATQSEEEKKKKEEEERQKKQKEEEEAKAAQQKEQEQQQQQQQQRQQAEQPPPPQQQPPPASSPPPPPPPAEEPKSRGVEDEKPKREEPKSSGFGAGLFAKLDSAKEAVSKAADEAKESASKAADEAKESASKAADAAAERAKQAAQDAQQAAASVDMGAFAAQIAEVKEKVEARAREFAEEKKRLLDQWKEEKQNLLFAFLQEKLEGLFDHGMNVAAEITKEKIKDPYMPQFVKNLCDDLVDGIWPDLKLELKEEILKGISPEPKISHGEPPCCPASPYAYLRYVLYPYDRSIWRQMRNPIWWFFFLASMVPKYGVYAIVFFIIFLIIDKNDEFQLYQFIVEFKSLQFLTVGMIGAAVGSGQYFVCTARTPNTCAQDAPQESFWTMVIFVLHIIMIQVAFLLMNCSEKKGGFYYQMEQESRDKIAATTAPEARHSMLTNYATAEADEVDERTRLVSAMRYKSEQEMLEDSKGRLMKFLIWDLFIFIICIAIIMLLCFYNTLDKDAQVNRSGDNVGDGNWKFTMGLWLVKTFYGFMSFPFIFLRLPIITTVISHARPTGYNPYGNTVPLLGKEEQRPVPWDPERPTQAQLEEMEQRDGVTRL